MSTLADLFNNRISLNKRIVLAEKFAENYLIYLIYLKGEEPFKVLIFRANKDELVNALMEHGISREDLYIIIHPAFYYKNSIKLPFSDPQKIEAVVANEVIDYLPFENEDDETVMEEEHIVDFDIFKGKIITYVVKEDFISEILKSFGEYSDNLKAIIPYGAILRDFFTLYNDSERLTKIAMIECNDLGVEVWGFSNDSNGEIVQNIGLQSNDDFKMTLSAILRIKKFYQDDKYIFLSKSRCNVPLNEIENKFGLRYYKINFESKLENIPRYEIDRDHELTLYSFLWFLQKKGKKINLLKGPFKPSIKNYIRVKDFVLVGILILILLGFSAGRFFTDMFFLKSRVVQLQKSISNLTERSFGRRLTSVRSAVALLNSVKDKSKILEKNVNRKYSALELFKEFTSALPVDVELEYTDIMIDQNKIRFNGKTKSFSDIDKIRESLQNSEYFKEVDVTNSGTTGSTGGFIVNFQFDIKCNIE